MKSYSYPLTLITYGEVPASLRCQYTAAQSARKDKALILVKGKPMTASYQLVEDHSQLDDLVVPFNEYDKGPVSFLSLNLQEFQNLSI